MKVIIVDDEMGMRLVLRKALMNMPQIEVIGEAQNGLEAVELVEKFRPDGVFMDVEMDVMDGIEAAKLMLDIDPKIRLIFITAHQQYMPQAFELYAFDYMIKPFKLERLEETVKRMCHTKMPSSTIAIKSHEETAILNQDEIVLIQRENRSTVIITDKSHYTTTQSLSELEEKLETSIFIRSHKSYIINYTKILKLIPYGRWTYVVKFRGISDDALITSEKLKEYEKIINL
jgi:two-component system LytT family response regulator